MCPVRFNMTGSLDIATDPADLPSQSDGKMEISGAMQRCTNLDLDRAGMARTRRGSAKVHSTALDTDLNRIIEQAGVRYAFAGTYIYKDETSIIDSMTDADWSAILYNSYATTVQSVFSLNGTDRKRIEGENIYEWGSESPTVAPTLSAGTGQGLTGAYNAKYTWARKEGDTVVWESNPSPAADDAVTLANQSLVIEVTAPTDTQITHIRIYRTLTAGAVYYWDQDIAVVTPDLTEYDYAYMYDWETKYIPIAASIYAWSYMYDWEAAYVDDPKYQAFNEEDAIHDDPHNNPFMGGVATYTWELESGYAGYDPGYKNFFPWEVEGDYGEEVDPATVYQAFTEDNDNNGIVMFSWEMDTPYSGSDPIMKTFLPWELNLYSGTIETNTADDSLGSEASWTNHDRPPLGGVVLGPNYSGICFILKDNLLYYSLPNQPEYWPSTYYIEVTPLQYPLKAAAFLNGQLFVASQIELYAIQGSGPGTFFPLPVSAQTGAVNEDCVLGVAGYGLFHLGNDGIYQYAGGKDQLISRGQLEPLFRGEARGNVPGMNRSYIENCWMTSYHGKLYLGYPGGTSLYPDNMIVMDLATNRLFHHTLPANFRVVAIDSFNNRLLAGDTSGYIWQWENLILTDDDGTAIAWQVQSKEFTQYYKYFPRYAKYDVDVNGGSASGDILLDDVSIQTHTITGSRLTRKRLVAGATGDRLSVRLSGSGSVTIYGVEIQ